MRHEVTGGTQMRMENPARIAGRMISKSRSHHYSVFCVPCSFYFFLASSFEKCRTKSGIVDRR